MLAHNGYMRVGEGKTLRLASASALLLSLCALLLLAVWVETSGKRAAPAFQVPVRGVTNFEEAIEPVPEGHSSSELPAPSPKRNLNVPLLKALGEQAERVASSMGPKDVATILDAYVHLAARPSESLFHALTLRARTVLQQMDATDVAMILHACGQFRMVPQASFWGELQDYAQKVANDMGPRQVADSLEAFTLLGQKPKPGLLESLRNRAQQVASEMGPSAVAETVDSAAHLGLNGDALWEALGSRARLVVQYFSAADAANTMDAYATLKRQPPDELWKALGKRMEIEAPKMNVKGVTHLLGSYAQASQVLKKKPDEDALNALKKRTTERAHNMDLEDLTGAFKALATLKAMEDGDSPPPASAAGGAGGLAGAFSALADTAGSDAVTAPAELPTESVEAKPAEFKPSAGDDAEAAEDGAALARAARDSSGADGAFPLPSGVILSPQ